MEGVTGSIYSSHEPWFFGSDKNCYIDVWGERMCVERESRTPHRPEPIVETCIDRFDEDPGWVKSYIRKLKKWDVAPEKIEGALGMGLHCEGKFPEKVYRWLMQ